MLYMYGCPMHLGVGDKGLIESLKYLGEHDPNLVFPILSEIIKEEADLPNLKNLNSVAATCEQIAEYAYRILSGGDTPLFIAGDHSSVMGSVSATSVYTRNRKGRTPDIHLDAPDDREEHSPEVPSSTHDNEESGDTGLIWIDAHPDINTDETTVTGNIHGMPVAALLGLGTDRLTGFLDSSRKLKPENVVMLGLRDIDPPEQITLDANGIRYYTYDMICRRGLDVCLKESISYLKHVSSVHLSFDIDSMNPKIMPGVSVPVAGGFTVSEVEKMFDVLLPALPIIACDIVEFNHIHDKEDRTASFVSKLVKKIQDFYADR